MTILQSDFSAACRAAAGHAETVKMTRILPDMLRGGDGAMAVALVHAARFNGAALPEAMTLFATPDLTTQQRDCMTAATTPLSIAWPDDDVTRLADCQGRFGRLGFSFPLWRYLAQSNGRQALLEEFGMQRLRRDTDSFASGTAARFGAGFAHAENDIYIEYRQAYLLAADRSPGNETALLIRNNSYFFGRDRLAEPVYAGWTPLPDTELQALNRDHLSGLLPRRQAIEAVEAPAEKLRRVTRLLDRLDAFDAGLHDWLWKDGRAATIGMLRVAATGRDGPPALATLDARLPPWFPLRAVPALPFVLDRLAADGPQRLFGDRFAAPHTRLAILSGPGGDLPFQRLG